MLICECERSLRGLAGDQRIEHDPAGVATDESDVGEIEATHLPDVTGHDGVQAVLGVQHRLSLQRWVDAVEASLRVEKRIAAELPDGRSIGRLDLGIGRGGHEAALRFLEIAHVFEGQRRASRTLQFDRRCRGQLTGWMEMHGQRSALGRWRRDNRWRGTTEADAKQEGRVHRRWSSHRVGLQSAIRAGRAALRAPFSKSIAGA